MPAGQQYATNVPQTTITGLINPTATLMSVASSSGWPATPFTAILEIGTSLQEPVDVTNITGTTWTIVRAIDSTVGFTHQPGATVTHGDIGRDFREARTHIDASTGVHGLGGGSSVVGTTDTQNLSNKTLVAPTVSGAVAMGSGNWSGTGNVTENTYQTLGILGASSELMRLAGGRSGGGPPSGGTFARNDIVYDPTYHMEWLCTAGGSPGTFVPTNKILAQTSAPTGTSDTFTLPSFSSAFSTIRIEYTARTSANTSNGLDYILLRLNGVSTANYWWRAYGATQIGAGTTGSFLDGGTGTFGECGLVWTSHFATTGSGVGWIEIPLFNNTTWFKNYNFQATAGDGSNGSLSISGGGVLNSTAGAVTSVTILSNAGNFLTGSTINYYLIP